MLSFEDRLSQVGICWVSMSFQDLIHQRNVEADSQGNLLSTDARVAMVEGNVFMGFEVGLDEGCWFDLICFRWWFKHFWFSPRSLGKWSNLTNKFSNGLKPPTSFEMNWSFTCSWVDDSSGISHLLINSISVTFVHFLFFNVAGGNRHQVGSCEGWLADRSSSKAKPACLHDEHQVTETLLENSSSQIDCKKRHLKKFKEVLAFFSIKGKINRNLVTYDGICDMIRQFPVELILLEDSFRLRIVELWTGMTSLTLGLCWTSISNLLNVTSDEEEDDDRDNWCSQCSQLY